jgi:hypothetical protein
MSHLWKSIALNSLLLPLKALGLQALRIDVLLITASDIELLQHQRPVPYEIRDYPLQTQVIASDNHRFEEHREFQKAPWHVVKSYSWATPSFTQKLYLSLGYSSPVSFPLFKSPKKQLFFWQPHASLVQEGYIFKKYNNIGYCELYKADKKDYLKINMTMKTPSGTIRLQESVPLNHWIVIDNPYVTALMLIENLHSP